MAGDDCEECCNVLCCSTIGYICCCRKMKKNTKIKIIWAWLIVLASTSGVILYCAVYSPSERLASPSDMITVQDHVNFLFCEEIKIKSPGIQFNGYVLPTNDVGIDSHVTKTTNQETAMLVTERSYDYVAFYLLEGSKISIGSCAKSFITLYVIIGSKNFDHWKQDPDCVECFYIERFINQKAVCTEEEYTNVDLYALISEEYFIIYSNDNYEDLWIDLHLNIKRKVYDLDSASNVCTETTECDIFLSKPDQTPIIWMMDSYSLAEHNHPSISTVCVPRVWAFLVIHGFTILIVGIIATVIVQKIHRYEYEYDRVTERTPLLYSSGLPPSYTTVMRDPPKYEDIIRTCDLPSYTQAVASLQSSPVWVTCHNVQNQNVQDRNVQDHSVRDNDEQEHHEPDHNVRDQNIQDQNIRDHDHTVHNQITHNVHRHDVQVNSANSSLQTNSSFDNTENHLIVNITNSHPTSDTDNYVSCSVNVSNDDFTLPRVSDEGNVVFSDTNSPNVYNIDSNMDSRLHTTK